MIVAVGLVKKPWKVSRLAVRVRSDDGYQRRNNATSRTNPIVSP